MGDLGAFQQTVEHQRKRFNKLIALNLVIGLLIGFVALCFYGCAPAAPPKPAYLEYPLHGKCFWWDRIEAEVAGHPLCNKAVRLHSGFYLKCTRKEGHRGKCHSHRDENCQWTW